MACQAIHIDTDKPEQVPVPETTKTTDYAVGDKVRLTRDIWDDGEDHHPPGYLAKKGEVLIVRKVNIRSLSVSHEHIADSAFRVLLDEVESA
jgi:hypothetical protein